MGLSESSRVSQDLINRLIARGDACRYSRGDLIIQEGSVATGIYILLSGRAKVFTADARGRELIFNAIAPGEVFGEMFLDGGLRSASVRASTDCECARVGEAQLQYFMAEYPEFAHCLVATLIRRLRQATDQVRRLGLQDVSQRVIDVLNTEALEEDGQWFVPKDLTQQEISQRIGATREMVNHVIRGLMKQGLVMRTPERRLQLLRPLSG